MRTNNIEKVRLKVALKAGLKVFDPGIYGPGIDPILLEEVRFETGTVEVLKRKGPSAPVIFAPVFKNKPEETSVSLTITSNLDLEEEMGASFVEESPVIEEPVIKKPTIKIRKKVNDQR